MGIMMTEEINLGLQLGIIGLSVTFVALGLLILVMKLLIFLFPANASTARHKVTGKTRAGDEEEKMAVALAVGISLLEGSGELDFSDPSLGKLLEPK